MQLMSCSTPSERHWDIQEVRSHILSFNGGRMLLFSQSELSYLELELFRTADGLRFYLNILLLQALPLHDDPTRTSVTIQFEDQEPWIVHPYILQGGQRLLFPGDVADRLIQALLDQQTFSIQVGRYKMNVIPSHFDLNLTRLLDLPIEECIE